MPERTEAIIIDMNKEYDIHSRRKDTLEHEGTFVRMAELGFRARVCVSKASRNKMRGFLYSI